VIPTMDISIYTYTCTYLLLGTYIDIHRDAHGSASTNY
jgi:hypothetical protein